ncbi:MAG: hypothetical protein CSB23_00895 [Deltaproteobacteria bacterium]|nr:MAG: hypothetical protein CSB23_00895 [Deltaproteobacteria bacterium]
MAKPRKNTSHYQYKRFWRKKWFWVFLGTLIFLCLLLCWYARITPLPKDEEMITHLQEHRAEFEEIIRRHRLFIYKAYDPAIRFPAYEEGMQELWKQAGIHGVSVMLLGLWLPDPYSLKTAQRVKEIEKSCADDWKQYHALEGKKCNLPPPQCRLLDYQYGGLRIKIEPYSKYFGYSLRESRITGLLPNVFNSRYKFDNQTQFNA